MLIGYLDGHFKDRAAITDDLEFYFHGLETLRTDCGFQDRSTKISPATLSDDGARLGDLPPVFRDTGDPVRKGPFGQRQSYTEVLVGQ